MPEAVKRRRYDVTGRREQARHTRARVLAVARDLFLARGYSATTIAGVAAAAGVSVPSLYKGFGNKPGLVKAVFDVAIAGDGDRRSMIERAALTAVREQPDPYTKLELYSQFVADTAPRHVPVQLLVRDAASTDPEAAELWRVLGRERLTGMTRFAADLAPHLRSDVTVTEAADILWSHNSPEAWDLLVTQRGWSPERYARHLADTLRASLLRGPGTAAGDES